MRIVMPLAAALSFAVAAPAGAQPPPSARAATFTGRVTDTSGVGIPQVGVSIVELRRGALTDADGRYAIPAVPFGTWHVSFQRLGYAPEVRHVPFTGLTPPLDVTLRESLLEIPGAQVTATPSATSALESPQPIGVLGGEALREALQPTLGATLERMPGVRSWSSGGGIAKPAIRGLRSDRVLVAGDGQRLENQQWGDEHGPQVETSMVDRIEVIRGPASVLYGSDALGGVINVIARELPSAIGRAPFVRGRVSGAWGPADELLEGGGSLEGGFGGLGWRGAFAARGAGDVRTPERRLFNSGSESATGSGAAAWRGARGSLDAGYTRREERIEIPEDPAESPGATPFQRITDDNLRARLLVPTGPDQRLELRGALERNRRREYEAAGDPGAALGLLATTVSGDARWSHPALGGLEGVVGASLRHPRFDRSGPAALIPASRGREIGVFAFEQLDRGRWHTSIGLRYDHRRLDVAEDAALGVEAQRRAWDAVTGNLGVLRRVGESVALVVNLGRGFRAPSSFDLYANGVHEGTVAYEVGDPGLDVEHSLNADVALRVEGTRFRAELAGFVNAIQDYIHSRPTGAFDPGSGFEIFQVVQGDARLAGFELSGEWHPERRVHLHAGAEHVTGDNTRTDTPLPWIPPFRAQLGVRWEPDHPIARRMDSHVGFRVEHVARQTRLDPADLATGAYTLAHAEAGVRLAAGERHVALDIAVRNLFDETYRDFMSRFKAYADAPGRNVTVRLELGY